MIKCDVNKCLNNQRGICQNESITLMMNNGQMHSLECLEINSIEDDIVYNRLREIFGIK